MTENKAECSLDKERKKAPDGGYGWVVLVAAFVKYF